MRKLKILFCFLLLSQILFSQNWYPLEVGNTYQFYKYGLFSPYTQTLSIAKIERDTIINNNIYYKYNRDGNSSWLRYSSQENKLFVWLNNSDAIYMDFNKVHGESFIHKDQYTAFVIEDTLELFSHTYICKGYFFVVGGMPILAQTLERFAENIGSIIYRPPQSYYGIVMAIIFDSSGIKTEFTNHYKPEIMVNPILVIDTSKFQLPFQVSHPLSVNPWINPGGVYFILSVKIESYYSREDSVIINQPFNAIAYQSFGNWLAKTNLDTNLLKNGFKFNYRIVSIDKGIIPETSYSPDSGYYQCVWDFSTNVDPEAHPVSEFALHQNYPNPFNPVTKITWQSPVGSHQTLKVFDVLGREVAVLVDEYKEAGYHEVEFDASSGIRDLPAGRQGQASGIYFYQLKAGSYIETKKMIVIK